jgi:delta(3,5)-delta(2,4)-dienoyl-CoA isomerase
MFTFSENQGLCQIAAMLSTAAEEFKALNITVPNPYIYHVELNRPKKLNAMNKTMWL